MEVISNCKIKMAQDHLKIQPVDYADFKMFRKICETNKDLYTVKIQAAKKSKTYNQVKTVWALVRIIFVSMEGRNPTSTESRELYEELLEEYAEKRPSKINPNKLLPIHVSKADTKACAFFIEGLMYHLALYCDLSLSEQMQVRELMQEWESWHGSVPFEDIENCSMEEYRARHVFSEASGKGGDLHLHHIVTKGSSEKLRDVTANWIMLTIDEHHDLHQYGEKVFLEKYPHLKNKFARARGLK